jgi:hypothetical protein
MATGMPIDKVRSKHRIQWDMLDLLVGKWMRRAARHARPRIIAARRRQWRFTGWTEGSAPGRYTARSRKPFPSRRLP